jgi:hypothetical protein
MVGFKGGCLGWWDEEKLLFQRSRVSDLKSLGGLFSSRVRKKRFDISKTARMPIVILQVK